MKRKDLIGGIQEECPHCKGIMNLESGKEKNVFKRIYLLVGM